MDKVLGAGRELNAIVAEKVMGWKITHRGHRVWQPDHGEIGGFHCMKDCRDWIASDCPDYSADISAAWKVVDKILETSGLKLSQDANNIPDAQWWCAITGKDRQIISGFADTAPLAICRAALKAVGDPVSEACLRIQEEEGKHIEFPH